MLLRSDEIDYKDPVKLKDSRNNYVPLSLVFFQLGHKFQRMFPEGVMPNFSKIVIRIRLLAAPSPLISVFKSKSDLTKVTNYSTNKET